MDPLAPNPGTPPDSTNPAAAPARPAGGEFPFLSPPELPGEVGRLGPYRVLSELGRGGMGVVYLAEETELKRRVALKVLLPEAVADPRAVARFRREAQAQAQVEHDHVVTIHSVDEANGVPFIVMPLLKGQTLAAALKRHPQPLSEAVRIGREIAEGLAAAHAVGLIHRDIKPGNVWLEAPNGRAKLLDFGLARATDPNRAADLDQSQTVPGAVTGTPNYMSPEQARGQTGDHRTDLYSLGVVLYLMTTGKLPFAGDSVIEVIAAVVMQAPRAVRDLNPDVPPPLAALIHRLLAKDPAHRPATAEAVAAELAALAFAPSPAVRVAPAGADPWTDIDTQVDTEYEEAAPVAPVPRSGAPKWRWPAVGLAGAVVAVGLAVYVGTRSKPRPDVAEAPRPVAAPSALPKVNLPPAPKPETDRSAAEWVRSVGGKALVRVNGAEPTWDYDVKDLPAVGVEVVAIDLTNCAYPPDGLKALTGLAHLTDLSLNGSRPGDAGVRHLRDLPSLRDLKLYGTGLTDAGCDALARLTSLRALAVSSTDVTDAGVAKLTALTGLTLFDFNNTVVGDDGFRHLPKIKGLQTLIANYTRVTDRGLAALTELPDLGAVELMTTGVTDDGLRHLERLPALTRVMAKETKVTRAGAERLAAARPRCRVEWGAGQVIEPKQP